jgi:hypothetical protein
VSGDSPFDAESPFEIHNEKIESVSQPIVIVDVADDVPIPVLKEKTMTLYLHAYGTLENRIKSYISAKVLQKDLKKLVIVWEVNAECKYSFWEIFENKEKVIQTFDYNDKHNIMGSHIFLRNRSPIRLFDPYEKGDVCIKVSGVFILNDKYLHLTNERKDFPSSIRRMFHKEIRNINPVKKYDREIRKYIRNAILHNNKNELTLDLN